MKRLSKLNIDILYIVNARKVFGLWKPNKAFIDYSTEEARFGQGNETELKYIKYCTFEWL